MKGGDNVAELSSVINGISSVSDWFWGLFTDFFTMITSNAVLLWPVIFAIVAGSVYLAVKVVRKFGLKGRR